MEVQGGRTHSAVLVPLYVDGGAVHAVFTRRRDDLRRHAGEISFPGGRREPGETLLQAALREAHEEVGLPPEDVDVVGALEPVGTFVTNYAIYPFVGVIAPGTAWVPQAPRWPRCSSCRWRRCGRRTASGGSCAGASRSARDTYEVGAR